MKVVVLVVQGNYVQTVMEGSSPLNLPLVGDVVYTFNSFATVTRRTFWMPNSKALGVYLDVEFLPAGEQPQVPMDKMVNLKVNKKASKVVKLKRSK